MKDKRRIVIKEWEEKINKRAIAICNEGKSYYLFI